MPQEDGYINAAMERGIDLEPAAFAAYEAATGHVVERTGFLAHSTYQAGCSLDGHVGEFEGIVELKCPKSATHYRYLKGGTIQSDYMPQLLHNLWVTGAEWAEFVSFDDRFPLDLQLFRITLARDERLIFDYEKKALAFLAEVEMETLAMQTMADVEHQLRQAVTA
jgi:hypothetical protein